MNYEEILKEIKPTNAEREKVHKIANDAMDYINKIAKDENIPAEAFLVGSIEKDTWLSSDSDIDIFISFPLETEEDYLKEKGLYLGYKCTEYLNIVPEESYASHPYLKSHIEGYDIDFVPCYNIKDTKKLKSAVDRTILHTNYIKKHLSESQKDEVLLLKKFMKEVGTYGSEFKVGGFAGYLCEILILHYGTFEKTLFEASNWTNRTIIDLENYETSDLFEDPLIAIDPTDKNRNVGAALQKARIVEFITSSRNFLKSEDIKRKEYFYPIQKKTDYKRIIEQFKDRKTKIMTITFDIPNIPADSLHPQLRKTIQSIEEKLVANDFSVFKSDYWTDEKSIAIFIIELNVYKLNKYYIHEGPKIWDKIASKNFLASHDDSYYVLGENLVLNKKRPYQRADDFIKSNFTEKNIQIIKVGKNLKDLLISSYELNNIKKLLKDKNLNDNSEFLDFLDDFLNPGQLLKR